MPGPLSGIRVIELGHHLIGPLTGLYLGDLGADVIKIEPPAGEEFRHAGAPIPDGTDSRNFAAVNRNKRSLILDLARPEGRAVLDRLLKNADVLIQNFSPDAAARLGLGWERLEALYPRLVYCAISAFGDQGAARGRRGFDLVVEAEAGLLIHRPPEPPFRGPLPLIDTAGPMLLAFGVASALFAREKTGRGEYISLSLLDVSIALQAHQFIWFGSEPKPALEPPTMPIYRTFKTKDGYLALGVRSDRLWRRLCEVLELTSLRDDPRFADWEAIMKQGKVLNPILEERFLTRTTEEWVPLLERAGVPCGRVRPGSELFSDPQVEASEMLVDITHGVGGPVKVMGVPLHLAHQPGSVRRPAPSLGEHNQEVLKESGYSDQEIAALSAAGVFGTG